MRVLHDPAQLQRLWTQHGLERYFDLPMTAFQLRQYRRGELLSSPMIPVDYFLIPVEGEVHFFAISEDGRQLPLGARSGLTLMGDMEFVTGAGTLFYSEAKGQVLALALPMEENRRELEQSVKFLHLLIYSLASKIQFGSTIEIPSATIEERVLLYLRTAAQGGVMDGVASTALRLRCSQRQLLRALKRLCQQGLVEKTGHGVYRITGKR